MNMIKQLSCAGIIMLINNFVFGQNLNHSQNKSIGPDSVQLLQTIQILTSDNMCGRLPGDTGYNQAANFMAGEFMKAGLKPFFNHSYFQYFNIESNSIHNDIVFSITDDSGAIFNYMAGTDFSCRGFSGSGSFEGIPVVFCGYGISDSITGYNDYEGMDVMNKAVLVFKQNPGFKQIKPSKDYGIRQKADFAYKKGAKVVLFVSIPNTANPQKPIGSVMHGEGPQHTDLPQLHIDISLADKLLENSGLRLGQLQQIIDSTERPSSMYLIPHVKVKVNATYFPSAITMNIAGYIQGCDPQLNKDYIVLGAHLDHVGMQGNVIYPGANDNASGSSVVLEIARTFQIQKIKPRRSIIFILFACEEQGLQGSTRFVEHCPVPLVNIKAMLNFDCVGHGDSIQIGSGKSFPELWQMIKSIDKKNAGLMINETWAGGGADAQPFFDKGVPTAYFVSKNSYTHLHLPSDRFSTLNPGLLFNIARLGFLTTMELVSLEKTQFIQ